MQCLQLCLIPLLYRVGFLAFVGALLILSSISRALADELNLLADPPFGYINTLENIKFSVIVLKTPMDVVDTVRLIQADTEGNPIAEVGIMSDDGLNGDYEAKDWECTLTLAFNEPAPIIRYYQAVVSFKNDSRKKLSQVRKFRITEKPYSKGYDEEKVVHEGPGSPFPVNRIVIELREEGTRATAEALARSVGGTVVGYLSTFNEYSLEVPAETVEALEAMIEKLKNDPRTVDVDKAHIFILDPLEPVTGGF